MRDEQKQTPQDVCGEATRPGDQFPELAWYRRGLGFEYEHCLNFLGFPFAAIKD